MHILLSGSYWVPNTCHLSLETTLPSKHDHSHSEPLTKGPYQSVFPTLPPTLTLPQTHWARGHEYRSPDSLPEELTAASGYYGTCFIRDTLFFKALSINYFRISF